MDLSELWTLRPPTKVAQRGRLVAAVFAEAGGMCKSESLSKSRPHPEAHEGLLGGCSEGFSLDTLEGMD